MAVTVTFYNSFYADLMKANINLNGATDTIKAMLCTNSYTPDKDAHTKRSDITNEVSGTGYSAGGQALTTKAVTQDNTNDRGVFDCDDVVWGSSTITARKVVLYKSRGGASSADELICCIDAGADVISTAGNWTLAINASGLFNIAAT